jgi:hypothetical protein
MGTVLWEAEGCILIEFLEPGKTINSARYVQTLLNGLVERLHRTKAAIMCHSDEKWIEALPLILLGIRTAYKEDLQSSAAELVYGEPLRVPGELLVPAAPKVETSVFIHQLRRHMDQVRPTPAARHASPATFVSQGPPGIDPRIPAAGCHTPSLGATLQRPAQSNRTHGQNT